MARNFIGLVICVDLRQFVARHVRVAGGGTVAEAGDPPAEQPHCVARGAEWGQA